VPVFFLNHPAMTNWHANDSMGEAPPHSVIVRTLLSRLPAKAKTEFDVAGQFLLSEFIH
jgi:hypothetical protein